MLSDPDVGWFGVVLLVLLGFVARLIWHQHPPGSGWRRGVVAVLIGGAVVFACYIVGGIG